MKTIYLAGGCFWGTQRFLDQFEGVLETETGYANGRTDHPGYLQVRYENTGHAETVRVLFDEQVLPVAKLLDFYFMSIDPFSMNRQGEDEGTQYRTGIYYADESLLPEIVAVVRSRERIAGRPLAVEVRPLENFWPAEEYHQKYLVKNPGGYCHIPDALLHLGEKDG